MASGPPRAIVVAMTTQHAKPSQTPATGSPAKPAPETTKAPKPGDSAVELGGPKGPEPTRYGDWERNGRCSDF